MSLRRFKRVYLDRWLLVVNFGCEEVDLVDECLVGLDEPGLEEEVAGLEEVGFGLSYGGVAEEGLLEFEVGSGVRSELDEGSFLGVGGDEVAVIVECAFAG